MSIDDNRTEVEGERTITPVAGRSRGPLGPLGKGISIVALVIGAGALLWFTANGARQDTAEPAPKGPVRQTVAMDDARPAPAPPPEPPPPPRTAPTAPRGPDNTDPFEASIRAPVMGWQASGAGKAGLGPDQPPALPSGPEGAPVGDQHPLDASRRASKVGSAAAKVLPDPDFLLTAGTILPCLLETAIDTTAPGYVTCIVPHDVLSSSGRVVLLEKGTKVLGEYRAGLRQGQERIFVLWNRAVTPRGVAIDVASPASDAVGRAGFDGEVETYFWTRFGGALMVSLIGDLTDRGSDALASGDGQRTQQTGDLAVAEALRDSVGIPPVLRKNQGEEVAIMLSNDLDFRDVYGLALR